MFYIVVYTGTRNKRYHQLLKKNRFRFFVTEFLVPLQPNPKISN